MRTAHVVLTWKGWHSLSSPGGHLQPSVPPGGAPPLSPQAPAGMQLVSCRGNRDKPPSPRRLVGQGRQNPGESGPLSRQRLLFRWGGQPAGGSPPAQGEARRERASRREGLQVQRPWGGSDGRRGEDCALKACMGGRLQSQEGPGFTDVLAVGGALWRPGVVLPAGCPRP